MLLSITVMGQKRMIVNGYKYTVTSTYQVEAQRYFDSVALNSPLSTTEKSAWNQFVISAKANGYYSKLLAVYPILGSSATQHAWNAITPSDFKLTYSGTVTHTSQYMVGDGTTGFANTQFQMSTQIPSGLGGIGVWIKNNTGAGATVAIGAKSAGPSYTQIFPYLGGTFYGQVNTLNSITENTGVITSAGFSFASKLSSSNSFIQRDASQFSFINSTLSVTTGNIYIGAENDNGVGNFYSTAQVSVALITNSLSLTEASNLYTNLSTFITAVAK